MGTGIIHVVHHVNGYIKFFQVFPQKSSVHHPMVPSGNLLPYHLSSEHTGVLSGVWLSTELKDRHLHTGLGGVCGVLHGEVRTGLK